MKQIININGGNYVAEIKMEVAPYYSYLLDSSYIIQAEDFAIMGLLEGELGDASLQYTDYTIEGRINTPIDNLDRIKFFNKEFIIMSKQSRNVGVFIQTDFLAQHREYSNIKVLDNLSS